MSAKPPTLNHSLNWGVLATGAIADCFARNAPVAPGNRLQAVASRSLDKAREFARRHGIPKAFGQYEELLADAAVDAVYIAVPHPEHAKWTIRALEAGKHVLCEKPLTLNLPEALAVADVAEQSGCLLMEAFMWRCHPLTRRWVELLRQGIIGELEWIEASFCFRSPVNPESRLFNPYLGGGSILDVGCYPVSAARLAAGVATGKPFDTPVDVTGSACLSKDGIDLKATGSLRFASGILAQIRSATTCSLPNALILHGTEGDLSIPDPWLASRGEAPEGKLELHINGRSSSETIPSEWTSFTHEVEFFSSTLREGNVLVRHPAFTVEDSLSQAKTLDAWRTACGVVYPMEKELPHACNVAGRPLSRETGTMPKIRINMLDKPVSVLAYGCDYQRTLPQLSVMADAYFEAGGNLFDTSYVYGEGAVEEFLGQWMRSRGTRKDVVILGKGGHTPRCDPISIGVELEISLERMGVDHVDMYCLHRDNPAIPVGEFVDALNRHVDAGRFQVFGGSNWSISRVMEANAYAARHGLRGFTLLSNNFSLARMESPVWHGCISSSDPESIAWHQEHQFPLIAWSSQARGYFFPSGNTVDSHEQALRNWHSERNALRREKAILLARKLGVEPHHIATAYVLSQPFPAIALIGPRQPRELRTTLPCLNVELTPGQLDWLSNDSTSADLSQMVE